MNSVQPPVVRPATRFEARRHIRGSSLLFLGRLFSMLTNFAGQVLTVRYLTKGDYGAFAYALSVVHMGASAVILGLNRAVSRFLPLYEERQDYPSLFGTLILSLATVTGLGASLTVLVIGLQSFLRGSLINDPLAVGLLLVLIALAPVQALDNLFQSVLAVFASARSIFWRRYVIGPTIKLASILLVMALTGSVYMLAACHLVAGLLGVAAYMWMLSKVLKERGLLQHLDVKRLRIPAREVFGFSLPLLSTDLFVVLKTTVAVMLLEHFHDTLQVAEFRAVVSLAGLNLILMQSFKLLYTPIASRLLVRGDRDGLNELFWQTAVWIAVISYPMFAFCCVLSEPVTVLAFSSRYANAAILLAVLSIGNYFNAAMGLNTYTLQVYARVRLITRISIAAVVIGLLLDLWLIPLYGAVGAAIATSAAVVIHNILNHTGLFLATDINLFQWRYLGVYATILLVTAGLFFVEKVLHLPDAAMMALVSLASLILIWWNGKTLNIVQTFPELSRIPLVRGFLGVKRHS